MYGVIFVCNNKIFGPFKVSPYDLSLDLLFLFLHRSHLLRRARAPPGQQFVFYNAEQLRLQCLRRNNFYRLSLRCSIPFSKHVDVVIVALEPERATVVMQSATSQAVKRLNFNHSSAIDSPENCDLGVAFETLSSKLLSIVKDE